MRPSSDPNMANAGFARKQMPARLGGDELVDDVARGGCSEAVRPVSFACHRVIPMKASRFRQLFTPS
jgi:hypothetical protein